MKILHITTSDSGGAGTAAIRLHLALLNMGLDSKVLCLKKDTALKEVYKFYSAQSSSIFTRFKRKFNLQKTQMQKNQKLISKLAGDYEFFSFPLTDFKLHKHPLVKDADIINLHWISNFIDFPSFFKYVKKPLVWTLHDMNPIQGGFHYLNDRNLNLKIWSKIEIELENIKAKSLKQATLVAIVSPTTWLAEAASKSTPLGKFPIYKIANGLDLELFKPLNKAFCCEAFNIPSSSINLLFVAENFQNYRKGFDLFLESLIQIKSEDNFSIITVGDFDGVHFPSNYNFIHLGRLSDPRLLSLAYNTSDALIFPSREDNLPNVMLESMACGIPVIAFPVGGMAETIINSENGILSDDISSEGLAKAIDCYLTNTYAFNKNTIRDFALQNFSLALQAKKYAKLYEDLLLEQSKN